MWWGQPGRSATLQYWSSWWVVGVFRLSRGQSWYATRCLNQSLQTFWYPWRYQMQNIVVRNGYVLCSCVQEYRLQAEQVDTVFECRRCSIGNPWAWLVGDSLHAMVHLRRPFDKRWALRLHEHYRWDVDFEVCWKLPPRGVWSFAEWGIVEAFTLPPADPVSLLTPEPTWLGEHEAEQVWCTASPFVSVYFFDCIICGLLFNLNILRKVGLSEYTVLVSFHSLQLDDMTQ